MCSHSLAAMNVDGVIDVRHMRSALEPVRGRGRPKNATKALQKDLQPDDSTLLVDTLKPHQWRKALIKHDEYGLGHVYSTRTTIAGTFLYKVKFMFAPGGPQQFEMEKGALNEALLKYKAFSKMIFTDFDSDDEV